jgi:hypothetical protein
MPSARRSLDDESEDEEDVSVEFVAESAVGVFAGGKVDVVVEASADADERPELAFEATMVLDEEISDADEDDDASSEDEVLVCAVVELGALCPVCTGSSAVACPAAL